MLHSLYTVEDDTELSFSPGESMMYKIESNI
jgi:hypothetical protein